VWGACGALFLVVMLLGSMLPPTDFDVREYHLQAPKEFYLAGRVGFLAHNVYANMPAATEMLSLLSMNCSIASWISPLTGGVPSIISLKILRVCLCSG